MPRCDIPREPRQFPDDYHAAIRAIRVEFERGKVDVTIRIRCDTLRGVRQKHRYFNWFLRSLRKFTTEHQEFVSKHKFHCTKVWEEASKTAWLEIRCYLGLNYAEELNKRIECGPVRFS